jgi:hypothetical protein
MAGYCNQLRASESQLSDAAIRAASLERSGRALKW